MAPVFYITVTVSLL